MKFTTLPLILVCSLVATAEASPIDNAGNFVWDTGGGQLSFNMNSPINNTLGAASGTLDTDLATNGDITFNTFTIGSVSISPYTVQVMITAGSSTGNLDAAISGYNTAMSLKYRVKVTGNGVGSSCITPVLSILGAFEGAYQYDSMSTGGQMWIYSGTGGSVGGSTGWLGVPGMTGSTCAGQETTINNLLGFVNGNKGMMFTRVGAVISSGAPHGS